ncbi:MAG: TM2 domain-containing protein [Bacteroidota bacterium]
MFIQAIFDQLTDEQARSFAMSYQQRRKDPGLILILTIVSLFVLPGIHRFFLDKVGSGILHLFTCGYCWIGTIIDLTNHKNLTFEYNAKVASDIATMIR